MPKLNTIFCNLKFSNPLVLTSGLLDLSAETMLRVVKSGAAGITTKGIGLMPRKGHPNPTVISTTYYTLNAVGLSNPGVDLYVEEVRKFKTALSSVPLIANVFASSFEEMALVGNKLAEAGADAIELNVSCPNMEPGDKIGMCIGQSPNLVENGTKLVKNKVSVPVIVKLTPNVNDIAEIAKAAEAGGADAVSAINTLGPGMVINIEAAKPVLANKFGGLSGPAIKPIAIANVYKIYQAVKIPIIGIGGISTGEAAIEMLMAGASLVGIGTAIYHKGVNVFTKILEEITAWMNKNNIKEIKELTGKAH